MTDEDTVKRLIESMGGKIEEMAVLPDGSGFATATMELPKDHWIYGSGGYEAPPMPMRMGTNNAHHNTMVKIIWQAARFAVRASTMNGKDNDFDPDALCQNMVVGLIGYHTSDGLSPENDWANPKPVPSRFEPPREWALFQKGAQDEE